jgi:signal peptidase I
MPLGGLKWSKEIEDEAPKPEKKGAEAAEKEPADDALPHVKAYHYVRKKHAHIKKLKRRYFPGVWGELVSFLFAFLVAWAIIQMLGWALGTPNPLVVVESESMEHSGRWNASWYAQRGMDGSGLGAINIGDIIVIKGDDPKDMQVGDVIIYTKYDGKSSPGGEPVIHRIIGIADIDGDDFTAKGLVQKGKDKDNKTYIVTPCNGVMGESAYSLDELRAEYSKGLITPYYKGIEQLDKFRVFITKGDNNPQEDQCRFGQISLPVHERLVQGRTKLDIPYVGYVKLGLVCAIRYAGGNACSCRCWWPADHPRCCSGGSVI